MFIICHLTSAAKICMRMDYNGNGKDCEIPGITEILKIIKEVRRYPALYDPSNKRYRDHACKESIWRQIDYELKMKGGPRIYKAVWSIFRNQWKNSFRMPPTNITSGYRYGSMPVMSSFLPERDTISNTSMSQDGDEDENDNYCDDDEIYEVNGHRASSENGSIVRNGLYSNNSTQINGRATSSVSCDNIASPLIPLYLEMKKAAIRNNGHRLTQPIVQTQTHHIDVFLAEISTKLKALNPALLSQAKSDIISTITRLEINQLVMMHQMREINEPQPLDMRSHHLSRPSSSNSSSASYDSQVANCNSPRSPPVEDSIENKHD